MSTIDALAARGGEDGSERRTPRRPSRRQTAAGLLLGVGFGGVVDGIVLHQILQWHHMLTNTGDHPTDTVTGLEENTLADGLFHVATWVCLLVGVVLLRHAWAAGETGPSLRVLVGTMLAGWGTFNLVWRPAGRRCPPARRRSRGRRAGVGVADVRRLPAPACAHGELGSAGVEVCPAAAG